MRSTRDFEVLRIVNRFGQLTSHQINELIFNDVTDTPCDTALLRLTKSKHLTRVGRVLVPSDARGGSGAYVYSLGNAGWPLLRSGRYRVRSTPYPHMTDIADAYIQLLREERKGNIRILKYKVEQGRTVGGQLLNPDLYVKYYAFTKEREVSLWLEVDRDQEHRGQMAAMYERYRQAYLGFDDELEVFPLVVTLVRSDWRPVSERVQELKRLISRIPDDGTQGLFRIELLKDFPQPWMM